MKKIEIYRIEKNGEQTIMERNPYLTSVEHANARAKWYEELYKNAGIPRKFIVVTE